MTQTKNSYKKKNRLWDKTESKIANLSEYGEKLICL